MTITLHDPVRPLDRPLRPALPEDDVVGERRPLPPLRDELPRRPAMRVPPAAPADDVRTALRANGGKTSFELASRGGYARTVTGIVAYLDEDAQTYMVLDDDDALLRVPLRDITSSRESPMNDGDRAGSPRDAEGLGTGP
jgi:hypothetical protein